MLNITDDILDESMNIGPGDILAFGRIQLIFTLNLDKDDLDKYKVNWEDLKSIKNLKFIRNQKKLWKRIDISSNDETMEVLLHINKTSKKLIKIGYVGFEKMEFNDKQEKFKDFIIYVTNRKGLYLTSCDICKCTVSIQLLLKYEKEEKVFLLCGVSTDINNNSNNKNNEKNEDNKEIKNKDNEEIENKENENKDNENIANEEKKDEIKDKEDKIEEKEEKKEEDKEDKNEKKEEKKDETKDKEDKNEKKEEKKDEIKDKGNKIEEKEENEKKEKNKENEKDKNINNTNEENKEDVISDIYENKNENINENKKENKNPFVIIKKNKINAGQFNYIYFNFSDYTNGELKDKIKLEHLFEYFQDIKIRTKTKIILNFEEEAEVFKNRNKDEIFKDLLSITDLFIFYNKKKLYEVLKDLKEEEDKEVIEDSYNFHCFEAKIKSLEKEKIKKKEEEWKKKFKLILGKYEKEKSPKYIKTEGRKENYSDIYITQSTEKNTEIRKRNNTINIDSLDKESRNDTISQNIIKSEEKKDNYKDIVIPNTKPENKRIQLLPIKPSSPKPLNKNDIFNYFNNGIFNRDPQKNPCDKIILVLDEFNKINIVKCNKVNENPLVLDFDLKLYPQVNVRNMNDILEYKNLIKSNFRKYVNIFIGAFLGVIAGKGKAGCEEDSLFLGYLVATNIIKKISEIQRYNLPFPKNKKFFYPSIHKSELNKLLFEANQKKKEKSFILDGNNKQQIVMKQYNPLLDKNLSSFLNTENNQIILKKNGFIGKSGRILYDPTYRDTLGFNDPKNRNNFRSIQNNRLKILSKDKKAKAKSKPKPKPKATNKSLVGYRLKSPGYSIYNQGQRKKVILPPINLRYGTIKRNEKSKLIEKSDVHSRNNGLRANVSEFGKSEGIGNKSRGNL